MTSHSKDFSARRRQLIALAAGALTLPGFSFAQAMRTPAKYKVSLPPSADLLYSIKADYRGMKIGGSATLHFSVSGSSYVIVSETKASVVGKILDERSEGAVDASGLIPVIYTEKRFRKPSTTATFDRKARLISFTKTQGTFPIRGSEQDRLSVVWQLCAVARAAGARFKAGSAWTFFVVGQEDGEALTFRVGQQEKVRTPAGEFDAIHVAREAGQDDKGRRLELWLAPAQEWYPVKVVFTEPDGNRIEQTLQQITRT